MAYLWMLGFGCWWQSLVVVVDLIVDGGAWFRVCSMWGLVEDMVLDFSLDLLVVGEEQPKCGSHNGHHKVSIG